MVPGSACAHTGVSLAHARPGRGGRRADRPRRRDEFPSTTSCATPTSASGSSTSSGRPTSSTARHSASLATRPRSGRCGARCRSSIVLPSERRRLFTTSRNVASRLETSTGHVAEVLPHPPQELDYRCQGYENFVLSVNRLDRAKRVSLLLEAAARDARLGVVITGEGPDRLRLERLAPDRGLNRRAASRAASPRQSSLISTRGVSPSTTHPWTRTMGWCRSKRFSPKSLSSRRRTRAVRSGSSPITPRGSSSRRRREITRALGWLREHRDEAASFGRAGNAIAREVTWDRAIERLLA